MVATTMTYSKINVVMVNMDGYYSHRRLASYVHNIMHVTEFTKRSLPHTYNSMNLKDHNLGAEILYIQN